jgi:hypothetical protein
MLSAFQASRAKCRMSEYSILRGIARADIRHEPYAHVVVEGCLPVRLYAELARTFPADETILRLGRSHALQGYRSASGRF